MDGLGNRFGCIDTLFLSDEFRETIGQGGSYIAPGGGTSFTGTWPAALDGQPYGCFYDSTATEWIYYHTIVEN